MGIPRRRRLADDRTRRNMRGEFRGPHQQPGADHASHRTAGSEVSAWSDPEGCA